MSNMHGYPRGVQGYIALDWKMAERLRLSFSRRRKSSDCRASVRYARNKLCTILRLQKAQTLAMVLRPWRPPMTSLHFGMKP
jgi:hypothetical protein